MNSSVRDEINIRWQKTTWRFLIVAASIIVFVEVLYMATKKDIDIGYARYILRYMVKPFTINASCILISGIALKNEKININAKNWIVSLSSFFVLAYASYIHFIFITIALMPIVAIMITSAFGDKQITNTMTALSILSVGLTSFRFYGSKLITDFYFAGYVLLAVVIVLAAGQVAVLINKHTVELMEAVGDGYKKQMTLLGELKLEPMTGLFNKGAFEEHVETEIENSKTYTGKNYLAMFDIDHFKQVNDTYGHSNGDVVLLALSKMMKIKAAGAGLCFRYGGEEFIILFNDTDIKAVMKIVEDIRTAFRCTRFDFMGRDGITISCGISELKESESSESWFNRADAALYKAKETGRNKTVISE